MKVQDKVASHDMVAWASVCRVRQRLGRLLQCVSIVLAWQALGACSSHYAIHPGFGNMTREMFAAQTLGPGRLGRDMAPLTGDEAVRKVNSLSTQMGQNPYGAAAGSSGAPQDSMPPSGNQPMSAR